EIMTEGDRSWCFGSFRSSRQILNFETDCSYTSAFPFGGIEGQIAAPTGPATGRGMPPAADTRHKPVATPRSDEKTISRLFPVHVGGPMIGRLSKVTRQAAPPVAGITKTSLLTPATVERTKATCNPSGANAGSWSSEPPGGEVRARVVPSRSDSTDIQERGGSVALLSGKARSLPSRDHARPAPIGADPRYTRRSVPPRAGTV